MHRLLPIALLSIFLAPHATTARSVPADGIAAVVGEQIILLSEVHARMSILTQQATGMGAAAPPFHTAQKQALEELIDETLIAREAVSMQIEVTTGEVESAIENMAEQNSMDLESFKAALESQGMTLSLYRQNIRRELLTYKTMNLRVRSRVNINEERAREFYNNQVRDVRRGAWFYGAHILVRVPSDARAIDVAKLRERATALKTAIDGGKKFEDVAKESSDDAVTAPFGGHLGKRMPGDIPAILDRVFLDLEPGEITGPIKTPSGFHIVKLASREDVGVKPFDQVKDVIIGQLTQKEMDRQQKIWLKELRRRAFINIRI